MSDLLPIVETVSIGGHDYTLPLSDHQAGVLMILGYPIDWTWTDPAGKWGKIAAEVLNRRFKRDTDMLTG